MANQSAIFKFILRLFWRPIAYVLIVIYMTFETLWSFVSDWVFSYTPLSLFSDRIHNSLVGRSEWLVLGVYLTHFLLMQAMAILSGKMFLQGFFIWGVGFYICKGLVAIPTVRFFVVEKDRLLRFRPIRLGYSLVVFIKNTQPYRAIAAWTLRLKNEMKRMTAEFLAGWK